MIIKETTETTTILKKKRNDKFNTNCGPNGVLSSAFIIAKDRNFLFIKKPMIIKDNKLPTIPTLIDRAEKSPPIVVDSNRETVAISNAIAPNTLRTLKR